MIRCITALSGGKWTYTEAVGRYGDSEKKIHSPGLFTVVLSSSSLFRKKVKRAVMIEVKRITAKLSKKQASIPLYDSRAHAGVQS
jgi:hypothetical protein